MTFSTGTHMGGTRSINPLIIHGIQYCAWKECAVSIFSLVIWAYSDGQHNNYDPWTKAEVV